jgi:hypothetical protein
MNNWTQHCYSRMLIDSHISEDAPVFMTRFDPKCYAALVKKAGVEASMVYACDHNGNCFYPTRVGHMHRNLAGRDIFGETLTCLRLEGITPVAYYTTIYHNHSAKTHPAWRMQDFDGRQHAGRYWWSCPNNQEYLEFSKAQIGEVIDYDVEGIFIDMTFWPVICTCANCRAKFLSQSGWEIPENIDWDNPHWIAFQRFREESMVAFCRELATFIKNQKDITVTFQNSPIIFGWGWGQTPGIANACDYTSGDFYGGKYQHILGAKILSAATNNHPFEYMTSRCVDLRDHTSMKSEAELRCEAATTLANGGAYFFIDAINPDGTLTEAVFERLGRVSSDLLPFTTKIKQHQAVLNADTGLYFSMLSFIDLSVTGTSLRSLASQTASTPTYDEMLGASVILTRAHRPFIVIRDGEGDLEKLKSLVINNAQVMSAGEVEKIREFVRNGGTLIATGLTSLRQPDGTPGRTGVDGKPDFALADVFGVSFSGKMSPRVNFLTLDAAAAPAKGGTILSDHPAPLVRLNGAERLAGLAETLFDPDDPERYASIHSNPPGRETEFVGLAVNPFGKGRCIYLAPDLLHMQQDAQQAFGMWLLENFAPRSRVVTTNAPPAVEITLLKSTTSNAWLVGLVNYQKELPNIPVHGLQLDICLDDRIPKACSLVSNGQELPIDIHNGTIHLEIPELETIEMVEVRFFKG